MPRTQAGWVGGTIKGDVVAFVCYVCATSYFYGESFEVQLRPEDFQSGIPVVGDWLFLLISLRDSRRGTSVVSEYTSSMRRTARQNTPRLCAVVEKGCFS